MTFNFLLFSIEDISTIKRKPFFGQPRKKTPSESSQIHQSFDSPIHQSNMSLTESDFINQALTGGGRISRSSSSNQLGSIRTDSPKVNIRHLLWFFDCLAHLNLSATLATDLKWPLGHLRISYQSLAECH